MAAAIANRTISGTTGNATPENIAFVGGSTQAIGNLLFTQYLLPFEVVSLVLLIGVVGAIVLALPERLGERLATISLGHPRGTDLALPDGPATAAPITRADQRATGALEATREIILVRDPDLYTGVGSREVGCEVRESDRQLRAMTELTTNHFLFLSAALFVIGLMGVLVRRNLIIMFMCVELMMNAVNLSLVAFSRETNTMYGEGFVLFTIAVAAAEAAVGLAIILALSRRSYSVDADEFHALRD